MSFFGAFHIKEGKYGQKNMIAIVSLKLRENTYQSAELN
jgi:hypothetical protein